MPGGNPFQGELKRFLAGDALKARDLNGVLQGLGFNVGAFGRPFGYGGRYPGGTVEIPFAQAAPQTSVTVYAPWYPFFSQDISGNFEANFYPGSIGGIVPSNMFSALVLNQSSVNYVYAQMTAAAGAVTAATLAASTSYPTVGGTASGSPPTSFNIPLAIFDCSQSPPQCWNIVGFGNIWAQPFVSLFTAAATPALLTPPFTASYGWQWGAGD